MRGGRDHPRGNQERRRRNQKTGTVPPPVRTNICYTEPPPCFFLIPPPLGKFELLFPSCRLGDLASIIDRWGGPRARTTRPHAARTKYICRKRSYSARTVQASRHLLCTYIGERGLHTWPRRAHENLRAGRRTWSTSDSVEPVCDAVKRWASAAVPSCAFAATFGSLYDGT